MSQQGPILVVSSDEPSSVAATLSETGMFPVIESNWPEAAHAAEQLQPAAVLACGDAAPEFAALAAQVAELKPYVPLIAIDPGASLPENALPFALTESGFERLNSRLRAALRVRSLHATVLRRIAEGQVKLSDTDPIQEATVLLIGRGAAYPVLSVALGERMGVVGALSIEAAAKHLNARDFDGIVLAEGFSSRVVDAFLTVLAEDVRFRNLPVVMTMDRLTPNYDLPNLELISGDSARVASNALPLIRQHALQSRLSRALKSIDAGGLLDPRTGLLTPDAFDRDFATAVFQTQSRGGGLSVARFFVRPEPATCATRWRADHRPPDAADGFWRGAGRWLDRRGVRGDRSTQRPHDRAAAVQRDEAYHPRQPRVRRAGRDSGDVAGDRFGEVDAGAVDRSGSPRRLVNVPNEIAERLFPTRIVRPSILPLEDNMKKIALITASLAFLAAPAFAEDAKTTGTAPAEAKFSTVSKDEMFSSKLKGLNVYNQKDELVGEITDLAIKNHQVDALILSVGGFLGMGEHYVAVSPSSVNVRYDSKNNKWLASMNTTKEALKAAPEFKYPK